MGPEAPGQAAQQQLQRLIADQIFARDEIEHIKRQRDDAGGAGQRAQDLAGELPDGVVEGQAPPPRGRP